MVTCRICKKVPPVLFCFIDKVSFYRIIVHIDEIRTSLFIAIFGDTPKR